MTELAPGAIFDNIAASHADLGELRAFLKAYRAMADLGYAQAPDGQWVAKDNPSQSAVHVDRPMGSDKPEDEEEKLYVPPAEVQAAAKAAVEADSAVTGIASELMKRLAGDEGLPVAEVRKVALYFATHEAPATAWGEPHARKWAGRVLRKVDGESEPRRTEANRSEPRSDFEVSGSIVKVDASQHLVFGWASICTINGRAVTDTQGDRITPETIEQAGYDFCLTSRIGGEMHERPVGKLIESFVVTASKTAAMVQSLKDQGIDAVMQMPFTGWWVGFKVEDEATWARVVSGELKAFSVGGSGKREKLAA